MWYPCKELNNNKGNQFTSLVWFVIDSLDEKQKLNGFQLKNFERILTLCKVTHVNWGKKIVFGKPDEAEAKRLESVEDQWWRAAMFDH